MSFADFDLVDDFQAAPSYPRAVKKAAAPGDPVRIRILEAAGEAPLEAIRAAYLAYGRSGIGENRKLALILDLTSYGKEVEIAVNLRKFQPDDNFVDEILNIDGVTEISI